MKNSVVCFLFNYWEKENRKLNTMWSEHFRCPKIQASQKLSVYMYLKASAAVKPKNFNIIFCLLVSLLVS